MSVVLVARRPRRPRRPRRRRLQSSSSSSSSWSSVLLRLGRLGAVRVGAVPIGGRRTRRALSLPGRAAPVLSGSPLWAGDPVGRRRGRHASGTEPPARAALRPRAFASRPSRAGALRRGPFRAGAFRRGAFRPGRSVRDRAVDGPSALTRSEAIPDDGARRRAARRGPGRLAPRGGPGPRTLRPAPRWDVPASTSSWSARYRTWSRWAVWSLGPAGSRRSARASAIRASDRSPRSSASDARSRSDDVATASAS